jgi:hypothetical protein
MSSSCQDVRQRLLAALDADPRPGADGQAGALGELGETERAHLRACLDCSFWLERTRRVTGALRSLPRASAPGILTDRVFDPHPAESGAVAAVLGGLSRRTAPTVLDRLVAEELVDPARSRSRRFVGDLERQSVPLALDERVPGPGGNAAPGAVAARRRRSALLRLVPMIGLAAAVTLMWLSVRPRVGGPDPTVPTEAEYRFEVRRATSSHELDAFALSFVHGLGGVLPDGGAR